MKLYEISSRYNNLLDLLNDPEQVAEAEIISALDSIEDEFDDKAVSLVKLIKLTEGEIGIISAEIDRLHAVKKARQSKVERIRDYLKTQMAATGIHHIDSPLFDIRYTERQTRVELDEATFLANNLNEELVRVEITPSKSAIKKALEAGETIIGAQLVSSQVLTIR